MGENPRVAPAARSAEFRLHWRALVGSTIAASVGTIGLQAYTSGAFAAALVAEGAYGRTQLSLATLVLSLTVAIVAPLAGMAMDRYGATRVVAVSLVGEAGAFALLGVLPIGIAYYLPAMVLLALLGVGTTPPGFARIVTARFDAARGLALGIMISGLGLMAMSAPIWANALITAVGWRAAYLTVAGLVLTLGGIGLALIASDRAGAHAATPRKLGRGGGDWSALRQPLFWGMLAGFLAPSLFGGGYLLHLIPVLEGRGFDTAAAARVQSLIGVAVLTGRLTSGAAMDRFRASHVAAVAFAISALGCLSLLAQSPLLVAAGALGIGLTIGAELDIMAYMISRRFGIESFGRLYSLAYGGLITAGGASPVLISLVADGHGYPTALRMSAIGILSGSLILLWVGRTTPHPRADAMRG